MGASISSCKSWLPMGIIGLDLTAEETMHIRCKIQRKHVGTNLKFFSMLASFSLPEGAEQAADGEKVY